MSVRKIVIVNQASNYLTIGFANAFAERFEAVSLITGSVHVQGETLNETVTVVWINKWAERPASKKLISYVWGSIRIYWLLLTRFRKHEVLFVSLPPMGYLLSVVLPNRCSMVIWDVYPDVFKITGMSERHLLYRAWARLNRIAFRKAFRLFTIGNRMADLLSRYTSRDRILVQPIWSIFQSNARVEKANNLFITKHGLAGKFVVQYSGNIGLTHKVEVMVKLAERMKEQDHILFQIIGRGPRMPALERMVKEKCLPNCQFLPFQPDDMFHYSLSAADVGVVILDDQTSKGSVPSKSYNLMSYGIPSLYIASADSELHAYAENYGHAFCCSESSLDQAVEFLIGISQSRERWSAMSARAERAATLFRRENADRYVDLYLNA